MRTPTRRRVVTTSTLAAFAAAALVASPIAANAASTAPTAPAASAAPTASYPSDTTAPAITPLLTGYNQFWTSNGKNDLHGTVEDQATLSLNDQLTVWINNNATAAEKFKALQDAEYQNADNTAYDQSVTIADGLGSKLSKIYVTGRNSGALPLTSALINSSNGTSGAYVSTGGSKAAFSYPRPYLPTDPQATAVAGDAAGCAPAVVNASSLLTNRTSKKYTDKNGNLKIVRVSDTVDSTRTLSPNSVPLSAGYSTVGICTGGSFPSGHTTTAYEAGVTLATLLPELAPEILTRASEAGNDRIVLGVHYPLDIVGGRIDGEAALAARWSDPAFVKGVLEPARKELVSYFTAHCGTTLAKCISSEKAYKSNPYAGKSIPRGTSQIVTDRKSAVKVYKERLTYGFPKVGTSGLKAAVPAGAENLLLSTFPTLTAAQRTSVLAQTEISSGYPLDQTRRGTGSWQRLNLAAATSATVLVNRNGSVSVLTTGGAARVVGVVKH